MAKITYVRTIADLTPVVWEAVDKFYTEDWALEAPEHMDDVFEFIAGFDCATLDDGTTVMFGPTGSGKYTDLPEDLIAAIAARMVLAETTETLNAEHRWAVAHPKPAEPIIERWAEDDGRTIVTRTTYPVGSYYGNKEEAVTTRTKGGQDAEGREIVTCEERCLAYDEPRTPDEYKAAYEHWREHHDGGCSHGM